MKHKIMGLWMAVILLVILSPDLVNTAHAGEINGAEQKVIGAVSATFTYQGKTYVIKSQYIAAGKSKLAEDGIDLSEGDANSYIAQFHNSYEELVEGGYCQEVGGQTGEQTSGKKDDTDAKKPGKTQDDSDSGNSSDPGKQDSDTGSQTDQGKENAGQNDAKTNQQMESSDRQKDSEHSQAEKAKNNLFIKAVLGDSQEGNSETATETPSENSTDAEWLEEEDLGTTIDFDADDIVAAKGQNLTISESGNRYQIQASDDGGQDKGRESNLLDGILHLEQWKILSYVIFAVAFCSILGISVYIWKVQKRHHKKRKLRLGLAVMAGISIAGCAFLLMFVLGLYFGVYNKEAIHRQLMESDYYSGITQMTRKLAGEKLQEMGCDEKMAAEVFTLSHVYIEEKQYIDAVLSGKKNSEISTDVIESALTEQLPDSLGENKSVLIQEITEMYHDTLQFALGGMIRENRQAFLPWCYGTAGISLFLLLLLFVLIYIMYGYLHKSVRVGAAGIFVSSLLVAGISLAMRLQHFAGRFHAEPVYYQQFIQKYINWSVNVMFYVGCIGVLVAVALIVWKRYLHMIYVE